MGGGRSLSRNHRPMLPGLRFLFAAMLITTSLLVFGMGAIALLRASHQQFASLPPRPPSEPVFAQAPQTVPSLSLLRAEPANSSNSAGASGRHRAGPPGFADQCRARGRSGAPCVAATIPADHCRAGSPASPAFVRRPERSRAARADAADAGSCAARAAATGRGAARRGGRAACRDSSAACRRHCGNRRDLSASAD